MAGFNQRFADYRPTKATWFWSVVGTVAMVLILGFTWGGWVTGGTSRQVAEDAAEEARTQLAADICIDRFMNQQNVRAELTSLKDQSWYGRDQFVVEGGWAKLPTKAIDEEDIAEACAEQLAEMELPAEQPTTEARGVETVVQ
jgi:hypothetical protein